MTWSLRASRFALLLIAGVGGGAAVDTNEKSTVIQKVITLLTDMGSKARTDKQAEERQYSGFNQFCVDTSAAKTSAIEASSQTIETHKANIAQAEVDAADLQDEIDTKTADMDTWEQDQKAATRVRDMEKADYEERHKDLVETLDAIGRAVVVLKAQDKVTPKVTLVQVSAHGFRRSGDSKGQGLEEVHALRDRKRIPASTKRAIELFLQKVETDPANAYEFRSSSVVDMLEKLQTTFSTEKGDIETKELASKQAYEALILKLEGQVSTASSEKEQKIVARSGKLETKATTESNLASEQVTKADDEAYLKDLDANCAQKASEYAARTKLRDDEIATIDKALEILQGASVKGHAEKYLPTLVQTARAGTALASLKDKEEDKNPSKRVAVQYLLQQSRRLHSKVLAALATRAAADPFVKVRQMIKDLLVRLMEEASLEATHKGWCDTELAANEKTRDEKTATIDSLEAEIEVLKATELRLGGEISDLEDEVGALTLEMDTATQNREQEHTENTQTIADAKEAQVAIQQAVKLLQEFYARAGEATALVQQKKEQPVAPEIFDTAYKGMQVENGGVIGILEVLESDFARLEAETTSSEAANKKSYDTLMEVSTADKKGKRDAIEHKTMEKQDTNQELQVKQGDLGRTQSELTAALEYYDKLKPSCIDAGVSYDERKGRREEEIASLQQALSILNEVGEE